MNGWIDMVRALGESLVEVLRAEVEAGRDEVARSARLLGIALALFAVAAVLSVLVSALLVVALVALLSLWLPTWAAALIVAAVLGIGVAVLAVLGRRKLRELENPFELVKRRLADHLDWWRDRLLAGEKRVGPTREGPGPVVTAGARYEEEV